jgi:hypothetical protein
MVLLEDRNFSQPVRHLLYVAHTVEPLVVRTGMELLVADEVAVQHHARTAHHSKASRLYRFTVGHLVAVVVGSLLVDKEMDSRLRTRIPTATTCAAAAELRTSFLVAVEASRATAAASLSSTTATPLRVWLPTTPASVHRTIRASRRLPVLMREEVEAEAVDVEASVAVVDQGEVEHRPLHKNRMLV